jgi:hypothetical protein
MEHVALRPHVGESTRNAVHGVTPAAELSPAATMEHAQARSYVTLMVNVIMQLVARHLTTPLAQQTANVVVVSVGLKTVLTSVFHA